MFGLPSKTIIVFEDNSFEIILMIKYNYYILSFVLFFSYFFYDKCQNAMLFSSNMFRFGFRKGNSEYSDFLLMKTNVRNRPKMVDA